MMNLLRRLASVPVIRAVVLRPGVRRRVAGILALRFGVAAFVTTTPWTVLTRELRKRGEIETYRLRGSDMVVSLQHGRDLEALFELFVRGEYEPPRELISVVGSPRQILDIGANVGMFSAWSVHRWPRARVTAFEPAPENIEVYHRWAARAGADVELVEACAVTRDGEVLFTQGLGAGDYAGGGDLVVAGLDVFPYLAKADLVKVDIEGGEWDILADPRLRDLDRLVVVMEYHRRNAPRLPAYDAARALLEAAGFQVGHQRANYWGHGTLWAWKP